MEEEVKRSDQNPVSTFLSSPAHHYDEDVEAVVDQVEQVPAPHQKKSLPRRFIQFMFEKKPSKYSSISPRNPDGTRSKIFFFNGNGRGR
jgi:hypothetical protein